MSAEQEEIPSYSIMRIRTDLRFLDRCPPSLPFLINLIDRTQSIRSDPTVLFVEV